MSNVGEDALGLSARRDRADRRSADAWRDARPPPRAHTRESEHTGRPNHPEGTRVRVMHPLASHLSFQSENTRSTPGTTSGRLRSMS